MAESMGRPIPDPFWKPTDSMEMTHPVLKKSRILWSWWTNLLT